MQVRTKSGLFKIGKRQQPSTLSLAIEPSSASGYLLAGIALGVIMGFVAGSVLTLLLGQKSLLLIQHLWGRLTGMQEDGERVHFELLLQ